MTAMTHVGFNGFHGMALSFGLANFELSISYASIKMYYINYDQYLRKYGYEGGAGDLPTLWYLPTNSLLFKYELTK